MPELTAKVARHIIETVGSNGTPPQYGFQHFTAGIEPYIDVIDKEYLATYIRDGGSAFKLVVGVYGGGKTHFLYTVRDLAWKHDYVVSYVSLSAGESPFHKLDKVYAAIVRGLQPPLTPDELLTPFESGMRAFLLRWHAKQQEELSKQGFQNEDLHYELNSFADTLAGTDSISFSNAIKSAFRSLTDARDKDFDQICQWLSGEGGITKDLQLFGISEKIDKSTASTMLRSLVQWIGYIGFSGMVILLDEAEQVPSLSSKQRELLLSNLREIIDECAHTHFPKVMIFYAVPDENFLEGKTQIYEALRQRLSTVFEDEVNPTGVKIQLEKTISEPMEFLRSVGQKLSIVYEAAYGVTLNSEALHRTVEDVARSAHEERYGDIGYRRLFVQRLIRGLHYVRAKGTAPSVDQLG